jgi:uncharacterized protein YdaU (DUF1376 family)
MRSAKTGFLFFKGNMNHYPFHIGDFNMTTRHLTRVERSLYRECLDMYYRDERPLPATDFEKLARKLLAVTVEEKTALQAVLDEFFFVDGEGYRNVRCDDVILAYHYNQEKQSLAGKASAEKRRQASAQQSINISSTPVEPVLNQPKPETNNHKPKPVKAKAKPSADFAAPPWLDPDAWGAWLQVRAKKRAAATPYALTLAVKSLEELRDQGHDPQACLDQSIAKGWLTFYPPKSGSFQHGQNDRDAERKRTIDELTGRVAAAVG